MPYTEYHKSLLNYKEKQIYSLLLSEIKKGIPTFTIGVPFSKRLLDIYEGIRHDHPEIYYLDNSFSIVGDSRSTKCTFGRVVTKAESASISKKIVNVIKSEFTKAKNLSEYEKTVFVYDWFMKNVVYNLQTKNSHNIIGALVEHQACCQGVAFASKLIFDYLDVKSIVIYGTLIADNKTESHAWNIVYINNTPYHFDATLGLNQLHSHLNISDTDAKKDYKFDTTKYPKCSSNRDNYFLKNNALMSFFDPNLDRFLLTNLKKHKVAELRLTDSAIDKSRDLLNRATSLPISAFPKTIHITYYTSQQVYKLYL